LIFQSIRAEFKAVSASAELEFFWRQWWPYSVTIFQSPSENNRHR